MTASQISAAAGVLTILIWTYMLFGRGAFWRASKAIATTAAPARTVRIAAVIPARDEAAVISRALESLLNLDSSGLVHVVLIDDHSSDGTAVTAGEVASKFRRQDRLTVIQSELLPEGWSGKLWAMHQGIERALALAPEFLLLTDADAVH